MAEFKVTVSRATRGITDHERAALVSQECPIIGSLGPVEVGRHGAADDQWQTVFRVAADTDEEREVGRRVATALGIGLIGSERVQVERAGRTPTQLGGS